MSSNIMIVQGHPDPAGEHFCHGLEQAYREGAEAAGHEVRGVNVARLSFPMLSRREDWYGELPESLQESRQMLEAANLLVLIYPLWLGTMPAILKAYIEQLFRPGIALQDSESDQDWPRQLLAGKRCRIVVTMGMPARIYRWVYRAHSLRSLERNILKFCGIKPVRESLFGMVEAVSDSKRQQWLAQMRELGRKAI